LEVGTLEEKKADKRQKERHCVGSDRVISAMQEDQSGREKIRKEERGLSI